MAAKEQQGENTPSLLDRLIDLEPRNRDVRQEPAKSLRQLKAGLRRDLEWLLNARRPPVDLPEGRTSSSARFSTMDYPMSAACRSTRSTTNACSCA
ncbi:MAG: hypothetical protein R2724_22155 [Bryobacterales bacterium]